MQKGKKILLSVSISSLVIVLLSLVYYSMRATILDYFFENNPAHIKKITSASGDQAQIMVDLANKQMAKQKVDSEVRQDQVKNTSLFKELSGTEASVKNPAKDKLESDTEAAIDVEPILKVRKSNLVQNGFVVVDCESGGVIACPHYEVQSGTSPLFYQTDKSLFLVGRCMDVSIDVKTFCPPIGTKKPLE